MDTQSINRFSRGFRDGIPIGLGYLSVSFAFGITAVEAGLPVWAAVLISLTNLTSAGQLAGVSLIAAGASLVEMAATQLIINLRYALMSITLSQKADRTMTTLHRMLISFFITDEVFAVASGHRADLGRRYLYGLGLAPIVGWVLGTALGAAAGTVLPASLRSALGIAIYGMFIAIIIPPARHQRPVALVLLIAVALSCLFRFVPGLNQLSPGFAIILCAVIASAVGAWLFPITREEKEEDA